MWHENCWVLIQISIAICCRKGDAKLTFLPRNSAPPAPLNPNWTGHCINNKNSIPQLLVIFKRKGASKYLKMPLYVSESIPTNHVTPIVFLRKFRTKWCCAAIKCQINSRETASYSICLVRNSYAIS